MKEYKDVTDRIRVDIDNERPYDFDIVGVTRKDTVTDFNGDKITLQAGDYVYMYTESIEKGEISYIFSEGYIIPNPYEDMKYKWCCKIIGDIEDIEDYNKRFGIE
jgi:hypothetical protein